LTKRWRGALLSWLCGAGAGRHDLSRIEDFIHSDIEEHLSENQVIVA
jgi:hypothetical protein